MSDEDGFEPLVPWQPPWAVNSKSDPLADLRAMRDMMIADYHPNEHVPGCVELHGEYICSKYCRVGKE